MKFYIFRKPTVLSFPYCSVFFITLNILDVVIKRKNSSWFHECSSVKHAESENETWSWLFFLEIVVTFFTQTLKADISRADWPIDLNFFMVTSYDLVYWCVKFQEISDSATTQTSLPTQKFQISIAKEIFHEIFWNFARITIRPLDKSWVSCTAIRWLLWL